MTSETSLKGKIREQKGKSPTRKCRGEGFLPGVLYGQKDNISLTVDPKQLKKIVHDKGHNTIINLELEGDSAKGRKVLIKDQQTHPLKPGWLHVDFLEIDMTHKILIPVPVVLVGQAPGEKMGGVVNHILREMNIQCLPADIPEKIVVQMEEVQLDQVVHISDLNLSDKFEVMHDPKEAVVSIHEAKEKVEAVAEEGEGEEGAATAQEGEAKPAAGGDAPKSES